MAHTCPRYYVPPVRLRGEIVLITWPLGLLLQKLLAVNAMAVAPYIRQVPCLRYR